MSNELTIIEQVENKINAIRTRSLDLSFNEILDMYRDGELIIDPEYQRLFRWSEGKQSRFIESLILELPVPPIFVIEREEGIYELIDGLQRISSYLNFRNQLKLPEEEERPALILQDCDIIDSLNDLTYEELPNAVKIKLKRNFIRVEILRKESDDRLRYYMFKRLNTGGELLSEQEIRNSTIRLLDKRFNDFLIQLSRNLDFKTTIENMSDSKLRAKYDQELVLRFFAYKNYIDNFNHNITDFLTEYMEKTTETLKNDAPEFRIDSEKRTFEKTFKILNKAMGGTVFARVSSTGKPTNNFAIYHFETFSLGLQRIIDNINEENQEEIENLKVKFLEIKRDETFQGLSTGGGKNSKRQLEERINFVAERLESLYE